MTERAAGRRKPHKATAAKTHAKKADANAPGKPGARIVVLTDDPHRKVEILPGAHLDSLPQQQNTYFFEDGNELVGMIVEGGTVEYHAADRTYIVRLN